MLITHGLQTFIPGNEVVAGQPRAMYVGLH